MVEIRDFLVRRVVDECLRTSEGAAAVVDGVIAEAISSGVLASAGDDEADLYEWLWSRTRIAVYRDAKPLRPAPESHPWLVDVLATSGAVGLWRQKATGAESAPHVDALLKECRQWFVEAGFDVEALYSTIHALKREERLDLFGRLPDRLRMVVADHFEDGSGDAASVIETLLRVGNRELDRATDVSLTHGTFAISHADLTDAASERHLLRVRDVSTDLLRLLVRKPGLVYELEDRTFERVVAEILSRHGYSVELTPQSRDGGYDLRVRAEGALGTLTTLVECKRWAPDRPVGVVPIRGLVGATQGRANASALVTSSRSFTQAAKDYQRERDGFVSLHGYSALRAWAGAAIEPRLMRLAREGVLARPLNSPH